MQSGTQSLCICVCVQTGLCLGGSGSHNGGAGARSGEPSGKIGNHVTHKYGDSHQSGSACVSLTG